MAENFEQRQELDAKDLRIRALNDAFRQTFVGGQILITPGVNALSEDQKIQIMQAIQSFDQFTEDNDPYGTHEFGSVEVDGQAVWFKIDTYDKDLKYGSPDPVDPAVTTRVMTILLPKEY